MSRSTTLIFASLLALSLAGQTTVTYNAETGALVGPTNVELESEVLFRVENFNPLHYSVSITSKSIVVHSEASAAWSKVLGWEGKADEEVDKSNVSAAQEATTTGNSVDAGKRSVIDADIASTERTLYRLQSERSAAEIALMEKRRWITTIDIMGSTTLATDSVLKPYPELDKDRFSALSDREKITWMNSVSSAQEKSLEVLLGKEEIARKELEDLFRKRDALQKSSLPVELKPVLEAAADVADAYRVLMQLGDYYTRVGIASGACRPVADTQAELNTLANVHPAPDPTAVLRTVENMISQFRDAVRSFHLARAAYSKEEVEAGERAIKPVVEAVDRTEKEVRSKDSNGAGYLERIVANERTIRQLAAITSYTAMSKPVTATDDIMEFTVSFKPRQDNDAGCLLKEETFTCRLRVRGGIRVDFGTGLMAVFNQNDNTYRLDTDPSDDGRVVVLKNSGSNWGKPALSANLFLSKRTNARSKPALTLGLAMDLTDLSNFSIYPGFAWMLGRDPWLSIHGGLALGQVDILKGSLEEGASYEVGKVDAAALTEKRYMPGGFLGVAIVLTKEKK